MTMHRAWLLILLLLLSFNGQVLAQQGGAASAVTPPAGPIFIPSIPTITNSESATPSTRPTITNRPQSGVQRDPVAEENLRGVPPAPPAQAEPPNEFQAFVATSVGRFLPMFGYSLFDGAPTTFAPVDRVPVTSDYVIGPGDEIVIRAWGQVDINYRATIDRNGAIHIPQIGSLTVGGLRYQDLHGFMRSAIGRVFRNFELNVNLGQLRSIQVFVVGQAKRPGAYTVSSLSTLVNALFASGGPSANGSMRRIQLRRGNAVVTEFDVYDLLLKGDKSKDVRLLPGDVIFIAPVGDLVAIAGSVNQPAIYELKAGTSLSDLIQLAGGLSTVAAGQKAKVERITDRRVRLVDEVELDSSGLAKLLQKGDVVQIYAVSPRFENAVTVRGAVASPGRFPWREGMRVRDVIPDQDSLIVPDYWVRLNRAARFSTIPEQRAGEQRLGDPRAGEQRLGDPRAGGQRLGDPRSVEQRPGEPRLGDPRERVEVRRLFDEINWDYAVIERLNPADLTTSLVPFNLGRAVLEGDPAHNLVLRPGDMVTIFSRIDIPVPAARQTLFVRLEGEVRTPGIYQVMPGETLRQVLTRIGGFTPNAYLYASEFTRESVRIQQQKRLDEAIERLSQEIERAATSRAQAAIDDKQNVQSQNEAQRRLLERMREVRATGRVVLKVNPDQTDLREVPELALEDGDRFFIPSRPSTVGVMGSVYNQTSFVYEPTKRVNDYMQLAGGTTASADSSRTYIVRADGTVTGRAQSSFFNVMPSEKMNPGDTIVVPENLERFVLTRQLRDWTQIFYQFALGVAGLKVLRDF